MDQASGPEWAPRSAQVPTGLQSRWALWASCPQGTSSSGLSHWAPGQQPPHSVTSSSSQHHRAPCLVIRVGWLHHCVITWVTSQTCFSFIWKMGRMNFPSRLQSRYSLTICRLGIHPLSLASPPSQGPLPGCVGPRIPPRGICVQPVWEGPGRGRFL